MNDAAFSALGLSLRVALWATVAVVPAAFALGWLLARRNVPGKSVIETIFALPLVLPPTAVGYLLLRLFAHDGLLGKERLGFDPDLLLTWKGAVVAAAAMSFPLIVRTARVAFEQVDPRLESMARTLGLGPWRSFFTVTLPLAHRGLLAATVLGFSRALGEFGATIVVAGNIPGRTQTLPLLIFDDLQLGRDSAALTTVGITVVLAFIALWTVEILVRRKRGAG